jgi:hypothetical protein
LIDQKPGGRSRWQGHSERRHPACRRGRSTRHDSFEGERGAATPLALKRSLRAGRPRSQHLRSFRHQSIELRFGHPLTPVLLFRQGTCAPGARRVSDLPRTTGARARSTVPLG